MIDEKIDSVGALMVENERLREREAYFAKVLGIGDGGRYRNDWEAKLIGVLAENERLREASIACAGAFATITVSNSAIRYAQRMLRYALREEGLRS